MLVIICKKEKLLFEMHIMNTDKDYLYNFPNYLSFLAGLLNHYSRDSPDFQDCQAALSKVIEAILPFEERMKHIENLQKLIELQRDLVGIDSVVVPNRVSVLKSFLIT